MTPEQATAFVVALTALITAVSGLIGAVIALWVRVESNRKAIDGRVNELLATTRVAGHAEGVALATALLHPPREEAETD